MLSLNKNTEYTFEYIYDNDQQITLIVDDDKYVITYTQDIMNNFKGFVAYKNDDIIFQRNINADVHTYHIQIETYEVPTLADNDDNVIHFWVHANDTKYYHKLCKSAR